MENTATEQDTFDALADARTYELGYVLVPTLEEDAVSKEVQALKDHAVSLGATILLSGEPALIDLAYGMDKVTENKKEIYNKGYFGWFTCTMNPGHAVAYNAFASAYPSVVRALFIKASREVPPTTKRITKTEEDEKNVDGIDDKIDEIAL